MKLHKNHLQGKVGKLVLQEDPSLDGKWFFFDENTDPVGAFDTEVEALAASHDYFTKVAEREFANPED